MFPKTNIAIIQDIPITNESLAFDRILAKPWVLGECDYLSLFNDYFYSQDDKNNYHKSTVKYAAQFSSLVYCYKGAMNPIYSIENSMNFVDTCIQDEQNNYQSDFIFTQTQASEENQTESKTSNDWRYDMYVSKKIITKNEDTNGKSTPMASGVMVVRDIQGKSCSRILRVLFDSGGSKSMMHKKYCLKMHISIKHLIEQ